MKISPNVIRHNAAVTRPRRETLNGHKSVNLWFTGLSCSGKSTLAHAVEERLHLQGKRTYVFDGDNVSLVAGACLAKVGNNILCLDVTAKKTDTLNNGGIPIYEPVLDKI